MICQVYQSFQHTVLILTLSLTLTLILSAEISFVGISNVDNPGIHSDTTTVWHHA